MKDTSISIRAARGDDLEAMAVLQAAGWRKAFAGIVPPELAPSSEQLASHMRERFADPSPGRAVAEQDGELRGFCIFGPTRDTDRKREVGEIYVLFVDPSAWRRGVGEALVDHAVAELGRRGFRSVTLWSAAENAGANAFYEKLGFVHDGARQEREEFGHVEEIRYGRSLGRSPVSLTGVTNRRTAAG